MRNHTITSLGQLGLEQLLRALGMFPNGRAIIGQALAYSNDLAQFLEASEGMAATLEGACMAAEDMNFSDAAKACARATSNQSPPIESTHVVGGWCVLVCLLGCHAKVTAEHAAQSSSLRISGLVDHIELCCPPQALTQCEATSKGHA